MTAHLELWIVAMKYGSGIATVDHYVSTEFDIFFGMSSRFAAIVATHVIDKPAKLGIAVNCAESGTV